MSESKVVDPLSMSLDQLAAKRFEARRGKKRRAGGGGNGGGRRQGQKRGNQQQNNQQRQKQKQKQKQKQQQNQQGGNNRSRKKRKTDGGQAVNRLPSDNYEIPARRGNEGGKTNALKKPQAGAGHAGGGLQGVSARNLPGLTTGVTVRVKNLNKDILEEDLQELFAFYGEIKSVQLTKGKGAASVKFRRRAEAEDAVKKLNGRELDGTPMQVSIPNAGPLQKKASAATKIITVPRGQGKKTLTCHACQQPGHIRRACPLVQALAKRRCNVCGKKGHMQAACTTLKGNIPPGETKSIVSANRSRSRGDEKVEDLDADLQNYMAKAGNVSK